MLEVPLQDRLAFLLGWKLRLGLHVVIDLHFCNLPCHSCLEQQKVKTPAALD